jgi:hypothetical protein
MFASVVLLRIGNSMDNEGSPEQPDCGRSNLHQSVNPTRSASSAAGSCGENYCRRKFEAIHMVFIDSSVNELNTCSKVTKFKFRLVLSQSCTFILCSSIVSTCKKSTGSPFR